VIFKEFVTERQRPLLRFAMVLTGDARLAEELVQDVLVRAFERWDRISGLDHPGAYIRRMIVNDYLSLRRRLWRLVPFDPNEHVDAVDDHAGHHAERDAILAELGKLPRKQRAVIALRYYGGLSDPEIADALGCTPGTVRGYASRALATLRIEITKPSPLGITEARA
jgi:RNA polymerase sigma-70 factor (sigma-E family)